MNATSYPTSPARQAEILRQADEILRQAGHVAVKPAAALPCVHLGEATGDVVDCKSCCGHVALKVFNCAVFGRCTVARRVPPIPCCAHCGNKIPRQQKAKVL